MRMNDTENYSFNSLILTLEQKGAIHILIYLDEKKSANLSSIIKDTVKIGQTAIYTAVRKLLDQELINEKKEPPYNRRFFSLTTRGKKVVEILKKLKEIA
ncbi:MAG: hypothetical protein ACTSPP_11350 [Candidatus Heimdallarchaeaceae archaeon]